MATTVPERGEMGIGGMTKASVLRSFSFVAACALSVSLSACQSSGETTPGAVRFDPALAAFINQKGKATIEGHAFLRKKNGVVVNAAGEVVRLVPVTPYAQERFRKIYGSRKFALALSATRPEPADPAYETYTRQTKAGANGKFTFENVGPGRYYVATQLTYSDSSRYFQDGGAIYDEVVVTGRETDPINVILSGN